MEKLIKNILCYLLYLPFTLGNISLDRMYFLYYEDYPIELYYKNKKFKTIFQENLKEIFAQEVKNISTVLLSISIFSICCKTQNAIEKCSLYN